MIKTRALDSLIIIMRNADENSEIGSTFEIEDESGIFDRLPRGLEEETMLRIHVRRFPRRDTKELRIKLIDGVNKSGTMTVPATGGFNSWTTITRKGISLPAGQHVLRLALDTEGINSIIGNLNWIKFTASTSTTSTMKVEAESASALSGITRNTTNLGNVDAGDWAQYKGLNLGAGVSHIALSVAVADVNAGHQIEIRQGSATGKILGTLTVASTGGYGIFKEQSVAISAISGIQDIYLTFAGGYGVAIFP